MQARSDPYQRPDEARPLPSRITLYQYEVCPYCCKVRAFLDYYKVRTPFYTAARRHSRKACFCLHACTPWLGWLCVIRWPKRMTLAFGHVRLRPLALAVSSAWQLRT